MNYLEWSQEYTFTAKKILKVIEKLKLKKLKADALSKKELDIKIAKYRIYYNECLCTANHLYLRYKGVE